MRISSTRSAALMRALLAGLLLTACRHTRTDYSPYVGKQQNWPTAPGAFVQVVDEVPIYRGFPDKPYTVLGLFDLSTTRKNVNEILADHARDHRADAVLLLDTHESIAGFYNSGTTTSSYVAGTTRGNQFSGTVQSDTSGSYSKAVINDHATAVFISFTPNP
jgi:hypothetical protein